MLRSSFVLLPRVGLATEARLWAEGCRTWDDYRAGPPRVVRGMNGALAAAHARTLAAADEALAAADAPWFARALPNGEHWRAWGDLAAGAVLLDLETQGRGFARTPDEALDEITVVGLSRGGRFRALVQGDDLTREACEEALAGATLIVTFNGASFDLPLLRAAGIRVPHVPHLDLRGPLRRLGLRGGLKAIEKATGLARPGPLAGLTGWDAVRLWNAHRRGEDGALETLIAYNREDVENMAPLARLAYDGLRAAAEAQMGRTALLA